MFAIAQTVFLEGRTVDHAPADLSPAVRAGRAGRGPARRRPGLRSRAAILKEPSLKSADIKVETYGGAVQLSGVLANQETIYRAVKATRTVEGVRAVRNHLRLEQE